MKLVRAAIMAFALYSRIPMPRVDWESDSRRLTLYAFPLVGLAVGGAMVLWWHICYVFSLHSILWAVGLTALPLIVTGGIHMDGYCDVWDARSSHGSREKKLDILKDPHIGAFGVLHCVLYLLVTAALWEQTAAGPVPVLPLLAIPVASRALSACGALFLPNARGSGLLAQVTGWRGGRFGLLALALVCLLGLGWLNPAYLCVAFGAALACGDTLRVCLREFGGTTGDLNGWFLQRCELACLAGLVLARWLEGLG